MEQCTACKYWTDTGSCWGSCSRLHINSNRIYRGEPGSGVPAKTVDNFSCNEFKEKPKEPFKVVPCGDHYHIQHIETGSYFGDWDSLTQAAGVRDHLNRLWEGRE